MMSKAPGRMDMLHYNALRKAIETGKVRVLLNVRLLNTPESPVYDPWENLLPLLVPLVFSLLILIFGGILAGMTALMLTVLAYIFAGRPYVENRLRQRVHTRLAHSFSSFQSVWAHKGIALILSGNPQVGCSSPDPVWRDFVALNFSDLMKEPAAEEADSGGEEKAEATDDEDSSMTDATSGAGVPDDKA